jgi:hypothetical protein
MVRFQRRPPPLKCKTLGQDSTKVEIEKLQDYKVVQLGSKSSDCKLLCWPQGSRATKDDQIKRMQSFKKCFACSSKSYYKMVATMIKKRQIFWKMK